MMLEQEKKNLEKLREKNEATNASEIAKAEANIRTLQEQLKQTTNEVRSASCLSQKNPFFDVLAKLTHTHTHTHTNQFILHLFTFFFLSMVDGTKQIIIIRNNCRR